MLALRKGTALVAGGGGFLGGHLVAELLARGYAGVRAVDRRPRAHWGRWHPEADNVELDLRDPDAAAGAVAGVDEIFNLAQDREAWTENVLVNTNLLLAADERSVARYSLVSSEPGALRASWQQYAERTCLAFRDEFGLAVRIARLHPVYGPFERRDERAEVWGPVALCHAFLDARERGAALELPGDGHETGCFTWIGDCIEGLLRIHAGSYADPIELGSRELVSTHRLVHLLEELAGVRLERRFTGAPMDGAGARSSDNRRLRAELGWEPTTRLETGLRRTLEWVVAERGAAPPEPPAPFAVRERGPVREREPAGGGETSGPRAPRPAPDRARADR